MEKSEISNNQESNKSEIKENGDIYDNETAFIKSNITSIAVSTPDEAYSFNHLEIPIKTRFITDLFLDQSDIIITRSFRINRSDSSYSESKNLD